MRAFVARKKGAASVIVTTAVRTADLLVAPLREVAVLADGPQAMVAMLDPEVEVQKLIIEQVLWYEALLNNRNLPKKQDNLFDLWSAGAQIGHLTFAVIGIREAMLFLAVKTVNVPVCAHAKGIAIRGEI